MDLELHQLNLRYEPLRVRQPARERRLLASIAEAGQQMPIVVVRGEGDAADHVVIDGYKRVRCLRQLHRDTVDAVGWAMSEAEALIFHQLLHREAPDTALEQGWLLRTLHEAHACSMEQLARRFDRSVSWVSRRVSLVRELPEVVQRRVQDGRLAAHAAMKYLVPLARANASACVQLTEAITARSLTTRQVGRVYDAYVGGNPAVRALVLSDPGLVLRLDEEAQRPAGDLPTAPGPVLALLSDLHVIGAVARRARQRLRDGLAVVPADRDRVWRACGRARDDVDQLSQHCREVCTDARSRDAHGDPGTPDTRSRCPPDGPDPAALPWGDPQGPGRGAGAGAAP